MKKIVFLFVFLVMTVTLSAKHWYKPLSSEDIEDFKILMELKAGGDIILPEIHVVAYVSQQDTLGVKVKQQTRDRKRTPQLDENGNLIKDQKRLCIHQDQMSMSKAKNSNVQRHNKNMINHRARPQTIRPGGFGIPQGTKPGTPQRGKNR